MALNGERIEIPIDWAVGANDLDVTFLHAWVPPVPRFHGSLDTKKPQHR
jgi:hypothetical protein